MKYSKELLSAVVSDSFSIAQVLRNLNLKIAGGNHGNISRAIKKYEIDTSHFLGQKFNSGQNHKGGKLKSAGEILILRETGHRTPAIQLRRALLEIGRKYECEECGKNTHYDGESMILEVDHIDNNWLNNLDKNLRFMCPNCHSRLLHKRNRGLTDITTNSRAASARRLRLKNSG